ncbi:hypothetical protein DFH08DRAFT_815011 [Mycena albidolilacea]|uniref:Uncharacterized protein n=1 Tax=Mycena albidolilacea TaxID=1033008 RepID=A0AAD6ZNW5_9AGAR|nr:hypothetical protein DFH08DRAFT_815011 [Mycena albidolilacea]
MSEFFCQQVVCTKKINAPPLSLDSTVLGISCAAPVQEGHLLEPRWDGWAAWVLEALEKLSEKMNISQVTPCEHLVEIVQEFTAPDRQRLLGFTAICRAVPTLRDGSAAETVPPSAAICRDTGG